MLKDARSLYILHDLAVCPLEVNEVHLNYLLG